MTCADAMAYKRDQLALIKFLTPEGCKLGNIYHIMLVVHGDRCVLKPTVMRLARMLKDVRQETTTMPQPGLVHKIVTEKLIKAIDTTIKENRCRNIRNSIDCP